MLLCMASVSLSGQSFRPSTGSGTVVTQVSPLQISDVQSHITTDSLHLSFVLIAQGNAVARGEALHIVPIYRTETSEWRLPEVLLNGKRRSSYYHREQALLSHEDYWSQQPYAEVTLKKNSPIRVNYTYSAALPKEFRSTSSGRLLLERFIEDCCDWHFMGSDPMGILTRKPTPPVVPAVSARLPLPTFSEEQVPFLRPTREERKVRNEKLSLRIQFVVNRHDILPTYKGNASELLKADALLRPLSSQRETYTITSAAIRGYASPEDTYEHNLRLSQRRADNFRSYIISRYDLHSLSSFPSQGMGEDWEGLRAAVDSTSYMPYRAEVLAIIDFVDLFQGREKQLMDLRGGVPYKWMLENLYPPLRRMEMEVAYTVRPFRETEIDHIFDTRPQDLSQEEIYLLARRRNARLLTDDTRRNYGREYDMAARFFPDDATALLNASSAALIRGEASLAWEYLQRIQTLPEAANNLGLYYWLIDDLKRAEEYLLRAQEVETTRAMAERNLAALQSRNPTTTVSPLP